MVSNYLDFILLYGGKLLIDAFVLFVFLFFFLGVLVGSLNLLTYALATTFNSMFFKVIGTMMTFSVVVLWALVSVPTVRGFWTGSLFQAPCLVKLPDLLNSASGEKGKQVESGHSTNTPMIR